MLGRILVLIFLTACSQNQFIMEKSPQKTQEAPSAPQTTAPDLPPTTPIMEVKDNICGGGRTLGKHLEIGGNSCIFPVTHDQSCDRWGCAIILNDKGDLGCPEGTQRMVTDTTPVEYFICVKKVGADIPTPEVCGGTRLVGKTEQIEECNNPSTSDKSCNRWGCAVITNSETGDSNCPSGTSYARTSDNLTHFLCFK